MSQGPKAICPVCGNYKQNGVCLRCNANAAARARRWRRGDRGGVRPERRKFYKPRKDKKDKTPTAPRTPSSTRAKIRRIKKTPRASKTFLLALQGEWYSAQKKTESQHRSRPKPLGIYVPNRGTLNTNLVPEILFIKEVDLYSQGKRNHRLGRQ